MKFRKKPVVIEATQWFKNGDHPDDGTDTFTSGEFVNERCEGRVVRYFRHPNVDGEQLCDGWLTTCGRPAPASPHKVNRSIRSRRLWAMTSRRSVRKSKNLNCDGTMRRRALPPAFPNRTRVCIW